ncbi:hypothetical protein ACFOWX_03545 [Sphingorhabdus arenilitoris]|uniref:Uncharacterized protein n=1 Tax=Sphingorhabdus arenilitoris TaxID=1490041 RepID=A0ABV8RDJ2_9SPHN
MSLLGGIMKSVINPMSLAQLAMGPAGWASLATKMLVSAVGQQVIQQLGDKLGLPQSTIDMAQASFCQSCGDVKGSFRNVREAVDSIANEINLSPKDRGNLERTAQDATRKLLDSMLESEEFKNAKAGGAAKGSIFMQIATALGKLADKKMGEMASLANQIGGIKDGKNANKITELTGQMQAKGQEFGLISNAMSTTIKSIGDGVTQLARKG